MLAFGVMIVTCPEAILCFLAGVVSSSESGNGPSVLKTMVRGVAVDPVFEELPKEMTLW